MASASIEGLPHEIRALITLAPRGVMFIRIHQFCWRIEHENSARSRARWMDPWSHSLEEWSRAIAQVMSEDN